MEKSYIGIIGLGVMGENLARNIAGHGHRVSGLDLSEEKVASFVKHAGEDVVFGTTDTEAFLDSLDSPKRILMLVKAGDTVDIVIESLRPHLAAGDILIDGGNEHYQNTERRLESFKDADVLYVGSGVSGGEEAALKGPSIMPGGDAAAWLELKELLQSIAAKAEEDGKPCCEWIGPGGSGHFVKMTHNGIEYGDMQMIAESYALMRYVLKMEPQEMSDVFAEWNEGELKSYLVEITADILKKTDDETGLPMVDVILDKTGQKGTGKWTTQIALDLGVAAPTIAESVFNRNLSFRKEERVKAAVHYGAYATSFTGDKAATLEQIRRALYCSKICSYAQGFQLLQAADTEYGWNLNYKEIAEVWRAGCIIRAQFLGVIAEAYSKDSSLENLLMNDYFSGIIKEYEADWRAALILAIENGISAPTFSSALAYFDGYRTENLPASLTQAQRDYFGAHTYERKDKEGTFHTDWLN